MIDVVISIHAPLWDATSYLSGWKRKQEKFQSTRPCGTRLIDNPSNLGYEMISIHAPLWDATRYMHELSYQEMDFNPRAPVGRDFSSSP